MHSDFEDDNRPATCMARRCGESLESTRSLTYLEWVHEKQTKRMRTRSEWFLSPVMPIKNNGASKSVDFQQTRLNIPKTTEFGSSSEDMQISPNPDKDDDKTPRQPLQVLQESTTTLRQGEGEAGTSKTKNSKDMFLVQSGPGLPAVVAVPPRVVNSSGVVRKKSWRTHYVRPNKSFDQDEVGGNSEVRFL